MKIIAADSAAAILDENFHPLQIVACAAVMVKPPYRTASKCIAEPIFADIENGHELVIHELELCYKLLKGKSKRCAFGYLVGRSENRRTFSS